MPESFTKSNPQLEREIAAARSPEQLRDILIRHQQNSGLPTIALDRVALPTRMGDSPSQSAEEPTINLPLLRRSVVVNGVTHVLTGYSDSGIDILEAALRK